MTNRRGVRRAALAALVLVLGFMFGFAPWMLGRRVTRGRFVFPDKENAGLTPSSFQLPFEDVSFKAADGVTLKGWWVPAEGARGSVVLVHGLNRSRIEMARKLPFLHAQGWNALAFDLRHHGDSEGEVSSFGFFEKQDVRAAVAEARRRAPEKPVVAWGVSLGGATATLAAAEEPLIAGLICDSAYASLRSTVEHHVDLLRTARWWLGIIPRWPLAPSVLFWMQRYGGFDPEAVDVKAAAAKLGGRPALFVCNSGDRRMPPEIAYALKEAAGPHARVLKVEGKSHGGAWRDGGPAYEGAVAELLEEVSR